MQSECRKKESEKNVKSQVQLKNAFATGVAFNIELHSRKINVVEQQ